MSEQRGYRVAFDPSNIVLTAGATSANEALMFCLADQGDAFLIPTPYYPGYAPQHLGTPRYVGGSFSPAVHMHLFPVRLDFHRTHG